MANDKDFKVKNGIQPTVYHEGVGTVVSVTNAYNLSSISYEDKSFLASSQESIPVGASFNNDGTKMYIVGVGSDAVYQYSLSTAFDVSTASYDSVSLSVSSQDTNPRTCIFNNDGTKMYVAGLITDRVYQYVLTTAYDLSTASYDNKNEDVSSEDTGLSGVAFNNDGTKMYISGDTTGDVFQYSLSTAFDVSTASYDSVSLDVASGGLRGITFNGDGTKLFICVDNGTTVRQYGLSTAYNLGTASSDNISFNTSSQDTSPGSITFNNDGTKFYIVGAQNDKIYQYSTALITNTLDLSTGSVFEITPTSDIQVGLSNPAASGTVSQATLLLDGASDNYNLSSASYDSKNFYVGTQEANSSGIFFHPQGTSFWMTGISGDDINQYALSTPWDVSTASLTYTTPSIAANSPDPRKILFNTDGTKVFILSQTGNSISEYSCAAFSTPSVTHVSTFSVSAQLTAPIGAAFNNNGTKLYVTNGNIIYQYSLSTAFDISTTSYDSKSFTQSQGSSQMYGIRFNTTGTKMYGIESANDRVHQYTLSTPDDISTASYDSVYFSVTQTTTPFDLHFKPDGTKMYVLNPANNRVYQYSTGTGEYTITYPSTLEFSGGTAPTSPAIGETDVITFSTTDGGTSYQAVQAIDGAK